MSKKRNATAELVQRTADGFRSVSEVITETAKALDRRLASMREQLEQPRRNSREMQSVTR